MSDVDISHCDKNWDVSLYILLYFRVFFLIVSVMKTGNVLAYRSLPEADKEKITSLVAMEAQHV